MSNLTPRINRLEPNVLINGAMELAQRGLTGIATNQYNLDRFYANNLNVTMTTLVDQSSAVPSNMGLNFSNRIYNTTTGTLTATTQVDQRYRVEGYDIGPMMNQEWSLIFWARSSVAGVYSVAIKNSGATHSYVRQYSIAQANTWELKVLKFPALSSCPGTLNKTNGIGIEIKWSVVTGTTFQTGSVDSWQAGNFEAGPGQVTSWLTSGNEFLMTGIMVLPGDYEELLSSNFQFVRRGRGFSEELAAGQRYFTALNNTENDLRNSQAAGWPGFFNNTGTFTASPANLPSTMRANPSTSFSSGTHFNIHRPGTSDNTFTGQGGSYTVSAGRSSWQWFVSGTGVASEEVGNIYASNASAFIYFDAEL